MDNKIPVVHKLSILRHSKPIRLFFIITLDPALIQFALFYINFSLNNIYL